MSKRIKPGIAGLPEWLQEKVKAYKQGFYLNEAGEFQKMGGYESECDWLGCLAEIVDEVLYNVPSWNQCQKALLFLCLTKNQVYDLWPDFYRNK